MSLWSEALKCIATDLHYVLPRNVLEVSELSPNLK
jgi:hypothetical protein